MKKEILIAACTLLSMYSTAQIKSFSAAQPIVKEEKKETFDSTTNFVGEKANLLIGQELYVIPRPEERQKNGYVGFYKRYEQTGSNVAYNETYELYAGKTFIVEEILQRADDGYYPVSRKDNSILKLKEKDGSAVYYYLYKWSTPRLFPFIIMGFHEKEKTRCVGMQLVLKNRYPWESIHDEEKPFYDVITGLQIQIDPEDVWTVKELTVDQHHAALAYMITNSKDQTFTVDINDINDYKRLSGPCILVYDDNLKKIHKESPKFYKSIMEGKIAVGMTQEMVRLSWGKPQNINHSSYGDTWSYSSTRLYFKDGILRSIG